MKTEKVATGQRDVVLGAAVLSGLTLVIVLIFSGILAGMFDVEPTRTVRATFRDAQQVRPGVDVRVDGVNAGTVESVSLDAGNRSATVTMNVKQSAGTLYDDASAVLRFKTVLGGVFYVDLERGSPSHPALGDATIPMARTARQVEVDDVTAAFKGGARSGLKALPRELADAFRDHQAPARLLNTAAEASPGLAAGLNALRGQRVDWDLQNLLKNTANTVRILDTPRDDVRTAIQGAAATLQTTALRGDDIRTLLRVSPPAGHEIDTTLTRLRTTLDAVDPLVAKLQRPAADVAPTFAAVRPVLVSARSLLNRSVPLLRALRPTAASLAVTAHKGRPLLKGLTPSINRTNDSVLPMLSEVDPGTQKSTAVMIGGTLIALSGAASSMDMNGHYLAFPATTGSSPFALPCQLYLANPDSAELAVCDELGEALKTYLSYSPLGPTPGTAPPPSPASSRKGGK